MSDVIDIQTRQPVLAGLEDGAPAWNPVCTICGDSSREVNYSEELKRDVCFNCYRNAARGVVLR
jgi:hypothetical protein